jgi:hypothetical protein
MLLASFGMIGWVVLAHGPMPGCFDILVAAIENFQRAVWNARSGSPFTA